MGRGVIFDVDGTLIDSVDAHARAWQEALAKWGKDVRFEDVRSQIGKGGDQLLPVFLSKDEVDQFGEQLSGWRSEHFKKTYLPKLRAFPRVRELIQRLLDDGVKVALGSSAKKDELTAYKKLARIDDLIATESSQDDVDKSKPHPDVFLSALAGLRLDPDDVVVVGDSPFDAEAAKRAALRVVGVRCGGFPEAVLREAGASALYDDPAALLAALPRWLAP
jgi:HAD superfamily hydrolase (TIGR01549 family)